MRKIARPADETKQLAAVVSGLSPERLIAVSRLLLAFFALAAIWLDPTQPAFGTKITYAVLAAYLTYSAALAAAAFRLEFDFGVLLATHVVDIAAFALLMHFTQGATSPFFVLFTFALFSATLRWNWQGALITTGVLVVLFMAIQLTAAATPDEEWDTTRTVIRSGYLIVAGAILSYLGALRERARQRVARLANWPSEVSCDAEFPPLERTLAHAAAVMGARRVLVTWEIDEEPYLHLAGHDAAGFRFEQRPPLAAPLVAEALAGEPLLITDAASGRFRTPGSRQSRRDGPLNPALVAEFAIGQAVVAPLWAPRVAGHVLLLDINRPSEDLLALAEIVASHIAGQLEHHMLHQELAKAAAGRERMRLARDVHDSVLQTLTALGLQLAGLKSKVGDKAQPAIEELQQLVAAQQRRLRDFVMAFRDAGREPVELKPLIERVVSETAAQWRCVGSLQVDPPGLRVKAELASGLSLMVMEAIANAVRHGQAAHIEVSVTAQQTSLHVTIADDGSSAQPVTPTRDGRAALLGSSGSRSLRERAGDLGGTVTFVEEERGASVRIELPL